LTSFLDKLPISASASKVLMRRSKRLLTARKLLCGRHREKLPRVTPDTRWRKPTISVN